MKNSYPANTYFIDWQIVRIPSIYPLLVQINNSHLNIRTFLRNHTTRRPTDIPRTDARNFFYFHHFSANFLASLLREKLICSSRWIQQQGTCPFDDSTKDNIYLLCSCFLMCNQLYWQHSEHESWQPLWISLSFNILLLLLLQVLQHVGISTYSGNFQDIVGLLNYVFFQNFVGRFSPIHIKTEQEQLSVYVIDQAENRGMVTRGGNLWDEVHLVNSRALISKIDVIRGYMGAICLIFVFKVSFSCIWTKPTRKRF